MKKTNQALEQKLKTPKKQKVKSKAVKRATSMSKPETYFYSVSDKPSSRPY